MKLICVDSFVRIQAIHSIKMTVFDPTFCSDDHRKLIVLMATIGNVLTEKSSFDIKPETYPNYFYY